MELFCQEMPTLSIEPFLELKPLAFSADGSPWVPINRTIFGIETTTDSGIAVYNYGLSIEPFLELKLIIEEAIRKITFNYQSNHFWN